MKKQARLALNRETIRNLDNLTIVVGGQIDTWTNPEPTGKCSITGYPACAPCDTVRWPCLPPR